MISTKLVSDESLLAEDFSFAGLENGPALGPLEVVDRLDERLPLRVGREEEGHRGHDHQDAEDSCTNGKKSILKHVLTLIAKFKEEPRSGTSVGSSSFKGPSLV